MAALSHFLNLDLLLKSKTDFTPLIEHLDQSVYVLHHQQHEQEFLLVLELSDMDRKDLKSRTENFLTIVDALPDEACKLWEGCISRIFSYGFEGGCDGPALDTTIPADLLGRIAKVGADIGITVYPCRSNE
ncbi:conserved hypothetical protein [Bradyrhizobium sp. STM 3843]|uniref:hypothetical protein n=1 Tax=Bradyrhizobium sp. STM 3843 TaxID=551947 RepID=UPI00024036F2|nr:hypothetical protein [Bradyrhizobium sp. STM 3843]CCE10200.1 conserved hypothetical protein [Bradyrhizobium sp. STM 3843]